MSSLSTFVFQQDHQVRVQMIEGEPWFIAKDICDVLSIQNPTQALKSLDEDERAMFNIGRSKLNGGGGEVNIINESGMYALVMRSRDAMKNGTPQHAFRKWVTSEVLPTIRKTGKYEITKPVPVETKPTTANTIDLNDPVALRKALLSYTDKVIEQDAKIIQMQQSVDALDKIANMDGLMLMSDVAKLLQMKPHDFIQDLSLKKWIFRRSLNGAWSASEQMLLFGLLQHKVHMIEKPNGSTVMSHQVLFTPKGLRKIMSVMQTEIANRKANPSWF